MEFSGHAGPSERPCGQWANGAHGDPWGPYTLYLIPYLIPIIIPLYLKFLNFFKAFLEKINAKLKHVGVSEKGKGRKDIRNQTLGQPGGHAPNVLFLYLRFIHILNYFLKFFNFS